MTLSDCIRGRDNNFNLIRIAAAYSVLITHSFALAAGSKDAEPKFFGLTLGSVAVDVFFLVSGFLVTASLLTRQSTLEFVRARFLRVYPALLAMLLLTVLGLGLYFTALSWQAYLTDSRTYRYFLKGLTLFGGVEYKLPGVFADNPFPQAVNGSLWTMPYEVKMYALLAAGWVLLGRAPRLRPRAVGIMVVAAAAVSGLMILLPFFLVSKEPGQFLRLFYMFFSGAALFALKERIVLSSSLFCVALAALLLAMLGRQVFFPVYVLTLPYVLLYIAYVPGGAVRTYNRFGDYSYGVYIYAFPVQQSVAALIQGVSVPAMVACSGAITLACAALSWHLVEKRALGMKARISPKT